MTRHLLKIVVIACGMFLLGAVDQEQQDLRGKITIEQLYAAFPVFRSGTDAYRPDPVAVRNISLIVRDTKIIAFLGTWCLDSRSEIPALLKTLDLAHNPRLGVELYAVNRDLDDGNGMADRLGLSSVPTVIVFRDGHEIGRIRGLARDSMESDLLGIFRRSP